MFRTLISTVALLALTVPAVSQVTLKVMPNPVPTMQEVTITLHNGTTGQINLPNGAPWSIWNTTTNTEVFRPFGMSVIVPLNSGKSATYQWDQLGNNGLVAPDGYEIRFSYYDVNWAKQTLITTFQITDDKLMATAVVAPGATASLMLASPKAPLQGYAVMCSFGKKPGIQFDTNRVLELNADGLFFASLYAGAPLFQNFTGKLDVNGNAAAQLTVPNIPALKGNDIYAAYVTLNSAAPMGILSYSAAQKIAIR